LKRINIILCFRAFLALSVFFWHIPNSTNYVIPGRISVIIFFGISSFVILESFNNIKISIPNLLLFYKKRLLRIYPVFFLSSILLLFIGSNHLEININKVFEQFLFFQFNHNYLLNGVFWTLGVEINFYLVAPLIILLTRKYVYKNIKLSFIIYLTTLLLPILIIFIHGDLSKLDSRNIIGNFSHFYVSFIAYDLLKYNLFNLPKYKYLIVIFLLLLVVIIFFYYSHSFLFWTLGGLLLDLMILIILLIHYRLSEIKIKENVFISIFEYLGKISFGIYAYHYVVFIIFPYKHFNILFILLVTISLSTISYLFFEPYFLSFIKKKKIN
jgi:peptidoglycan/LPS O-acetylase OafA/YrhL